MKIVQVSDVHVEFGALDKPLPNGDVLILGGDIELSLTHIPAKPTQLEFLRASGAVSAVAELRSMAAILDVRGGAGDEEERVAPRFHVKPLS